MLTKKTIGFLGAGNMGEALIKGLIASHKVSPGQLRVCDTNPEKRIHIGTTYTVKVYNESFEVARAADIIFLGVKPADSAALLKDIAPEITNGKLIVSIMAGITTDAIIEGLGREVAVVRAMPNTPAIVGEGMVGIVAGRATGRDSVALVASLFETVGRVVCLPNEELMDAVTGLSGSGPAYVFLFMEALQEAGVRLGLDRDTATLAAIQTVLGAAKLAMESEMGPAKLREMVTSPGGTTLAGLKTLEDGRFYDTIIKAVEAAARRSGELSK